MNQVWWGPWVVLSIRPWGVIGDQLQKKNMKCGVNSKIFPVILIYKCQKVFFPTLWMDSHMGPKTWLKPLCNQKFLMFNHTSSPSWNFTSCRDLSAKSLYLLCVFSKLAFATSHKHCLFSSSCVTIGTSSLASLVVCPCATSHGHNWWLARPFERGWIQLRNVPICCNKTRLTQMVHPILLIHRHVIP